MIIIYTFVPESNHVRIVWIFNIFNIFSRLFVSFHINFNFHVPNY